MEMVRRVITLILLPFIILVGCSKMQNDDFDPVENDSFCESLLSGKDNEELFSWLEKEDDVEKTLGEMPTQEEVVHFAQELRSLKPKAVWAVDIERASETSLLENTGQLCVALPKDPDLRLALIEFGNDLSESLGFEGMPDKGQKYMYVRLD